MLMTGVPVLPEAHERIAMQHQQDELVPINDVLADLPGRSRRSAKQ